ncbi:hypothetical protein [Aliivibrio logei]|uniref:hypothetical protein n=1 Tax=Aliivibrio logei TaxID=688 RepID=UPI0002FA6B63|nr:hypothetical protein [Aliivibrio logei]
MCDLNEDFKDLEINFTPSEIRMLGWDDKEWIIESITFIASICMIIYFFLF